MTDRLKHGTKYPSVDELPKGATLLNVYKHTLNLKNAASVCVKYDRYLADKGPNPGYKIVNWQGFNFAVPL